MSDGNDNSQGRKHSGEAIDDMRNNGEIDGKKIDGNFGENVISDCHSDTTVSSHDIGKAKRDIGTCNSGIHNKKPRVDVSCDVEDDDDVTPPSKDVVDSSLKETTSDQLQSGHRTIYDSQLEDKARTAENYSVFSSFAGTASPFASVSAKSEGSQLSSAFGAQVNCASTISQGNGKDAGEVSNGLATFVKPNAVSSSCAADDEKLNQGNDDMSNENSISEGESGKSGQFSNW
jgi:hypothetical protein